MPLAYDTSPNHVPTQRLGSHTQSQHWRHSHGTGRRTFSLARRRGLPTRHERRPRATEDCPARMKPCPGKRSERDRRRKERAKGCDGERWSHPPMHAQGCSMHASQLCFSSWQMRLRCFRVAHHPAPDLLLQGQSHSDAYRKRGASLRSSVAKTSSSPGSASDCSSAPRLAFLSLAHRSANLTPDARSHSATAQNRHRAL